MLNLKTSLFLFPLPLYIEKEMSDPKDRPFISSIRKRLDPIEYRPHIHHRLHLDDDSFDLKYSALLWNQSLIKELKNQCFDRQAEKLFSKVYDYYLQNIGCSEVLPVILVKYCKL